MLLPSCRSRCCRACLVVGLLVFGFGISIHAQTDKDAEEYRAAAKLGDEGDNKGAEAGFDKLLARFPENAAIRYARAVVRHRQGKFQPAIDDLDVVISVKPQMTDAYLLRADARANLKSYEGALADTNMAVRLTKNAEWIPLMTRARLQQLFGKRAEAIADYTAVLTLDADNFDARFARADLQINLGNCEQAQADLLRLIEDRQDDARIRLRLAAAEFGLTHWDDARQNLEKAVQFGAVAADTARLWGLVSFAQGDFNGAALKLREADLAHDAYVQLMLHLAQRRGGKAAPELKAAIPSMENKWAQLIGYYLVGELKEEELLATAEGKADAVEKRGHTCEAYFYIGQLRLIAGDRIAAKALFQQAIATGAKDYDEYTLAQGELAR